MKENISCEIIQDLLPNYIEGIVSNETEDLVKSHLDNCLYCKKEWENMNTLIQTTPVHEKKIDYLKRIHNKCKNILLSCVILSVIAFLIGIFISEANTDDAIFVLLLFSFILIFMIIKFGLPLFGAVASFFWYKKTKKKWILVISFICSCLFFYSIFSVVKNILIYGF